ncbi:deoxyribodipyrimidine photo-lyase [soil metagenome]
MSDDAPVILWFRRDLRLADNAALHAAAQSGRPVIPVFVLDLDQPAAPGAAGLWWLDKSLAALGEALKAAGSPLILRKGHSVEILRELAKDTGATQLFFGRSYAGGDAQVEAAVAADGVEVVACEGSLLSPPGSVLTGGGEPYKVYGPFWRALRARLEPPKLVPAVRTLSAPSSPPRSDRLADWKLHPTQPDWSKALEGEPGEAGAHRTLKRFIGDGLRRYAADRANPAGRTSSHLSPHLHWGELSSRQVWSAVGEAAEAHGLEAGREKFLSELAWRDFSHEVLRATPDLATRNYQDRLEALPWRTDAKGLEAWRKGLTGYPIVDAGMRQLWRSGWMHNRVRMITGSFLIKDLLIDWREGERWFWDCLMDADEANNALNWQWVAGTGPDASPFFRVFNPVAQGEKFDPDGAYVREWIPELRKLDKRFIHQPWTASPLELAAAGVRLGETYPKPIVDHAAARDRALAAYKGLKG